jgi:serine/threonine protein kinase
MFVDYGTTSSRPRARFTDFGNAIDAASGVAVDEAVTVTVTVTVTADHLSPVQARNERLTAASDIYSLGLVLLECFTQTLAFSSSG